MAIEQSEFVIEDRRCTVEMTAAANGSSHQLKWVQDNSVVYVQSEENVLEMRNVLLTQLQSSSTRIGFRT